MVRARRRLLVRSMLISAALSLMSTAVALAGGGGVAYP
jgi:hypothetical protein